MLPDPVLLDAAFVAFVAAFVVVVLDAGLLDVVAASARVGAAIIENKAGKVHTAMNFFMIDLQFSKIRKMAVKQAQSCFSKVGLQESVSKIWFTKAGLRLAVFNGEVTEGNRRQTVEIRLFLNP